MKNEGMTIQEISQKLNIPRRKIDNIVFAKKLIVKRVKCSSAEMSRRLLFIRSNLHLTQRELSVALNVSNHIIRNICRVYKIQTARRWASPAEKAARLDFMAAHPEYTKREFAEKMGISESTAYRMLWASGLPYRQVYKKRSRPIVSKGEVLRVPRKNFMNNFLMGSN